MVFTAYTIPRRQAAAKAKQDETAREAEAVAEEETRQSVKESLKTSEIELCLGKQLSSALLPAHGELAHRVSKMRRKFAKQYGFVIPEIKLSDDLAIDPKRYQIKIHGTVVATGELRIGDVMVIIGDGPRPTVPGDDTREPAFGMKALWLSEMFVSNAEARGLRARRQHVGAADPSGRDHPQQSGAAAVLQGYARADRPARPGISAADRRDDPGASDLSPAFRPC